MSVISSACACVSDQDRGCTERDFHSVDDERAAERRIVRDGDPNVPVHGVFGARVLHLVDDRPTGGAADINGGPTRDWARLRQRRDLGRNVTDVFNR